MELPKIISVDDHVVEPPHVWQTWLPEKHRERGPKVVRKRWGGFKLKGGAKYEMEEDPDGLWGDAWVYDDELIYVHKRFVAIPESAVSENGDGLTLDRSQLQMTALTYDDMRQGCWDRDARIADMELNWVDGSLPFPTFPRFCGQTFHENEDRELGLACVQAYNDWMVDEWCRSVGRRQHPSLHHPAVGSRARRPGDAAQRRPRRARHLLQRAADAPQAAEHPLGLLGSAVAGVQRHRRHGLHARRLVVDQPRGFARRPAGRRRDVVVQQLVRVADRLALLRQARAVPEAEARLLGGPDRLDPLRARTGRHRVGAPRRLAAHARSIPEPPSTYYYGRIYGCFTADRHGLKNLDEVGPDNICFETDYPHTDTTWPETKAYVEKMLAGYDEETAYKVLRGNAIKMLELDRT